MNLSARLRLSSLQNASAERLFLNRTAARPLKYHRKADSMYISMNSSRE